MKKKYVLQESKNKKRIDFTNAPLMKLLISFSIPLIITNILFTLYQIIDAYWVGQLGEAAVAGVSLTFPIFFIISSIAFSISSTGSILIAQYHGRKDKEKVNYYANQTISILTIIGFIIGLIGYLIAPQIISFFGAEEIVTNYASDYLGILFLGMVFFFFYNSVSTIVRSVGEVRLLVEVAVLTTLINFVLDPILMLGLFGVPRLGVSGVAWATTITNIFSAIMALYWLTKNKHILHIQRKYLEVSKTTIHKFVKLGVPALIEFLSRAISSILITFIVAGFGTTIIAAYGIGSRISSFVLIPIFGVSIAVSTIVGQNLGAKKYERVDDVIKKGTFLGFTILFLLGGIVSIFATQIATAFVIGSEKVVEESSIFIILNSLSLALITSQIMIISSYRAAGHTITSMSLSILYIILQIGTVVLFSILFGSRGIWIGHATANIASTILIQIYYKFNPITSSGLEVTKQ